MSSKLEKRYERVKSLLDTRGSITFGDKKDGDAAVMALDHITHVVRKGNKIIFHLVGGKTVEYKEEK